VVQKLDKDYFIGMKSGELEVIDTIPGTRSLVKKVICSCSCGEQLEVSKSDFLNGRYKYCNSCRKEVATKHLDNIRPSKGFDLAGEKYGRLSVLRLATLEEKLIAGKPINRAKKRRHWVCLCDCGKETIIEQRLLTGKAYAQKSCGCFIAVGNLIKTSKANLTEEYVLQFKDIEKYAFLHKSFSHAKGTDLSSEEYKKFMDQHYNGIQFNKIYNNWKESERGETFYDLAKPSVDHILPLSRGGTSNADNLQFLTVFENLCKRDMTQEEWENFKIATNTKSNLFV